MKVGVVTIYPMVGEGIISILSNQEDIEFVGWAGSSQGGLRLLENIGPDILLVDANLGHINGLDFINMARKRKLACKFIMMGFIGGRDFIIRALERGLEGYILREAHQEEILYAIRLIGRGKKYYDSDLFTYIDGRDELNRIPSLTSREEEVLMALARGLTNKEIANDFFITEHTVKKHVGQILSKLELKDRTQAAIFANTSQLIG